MGACLSKNAVVVPDASIPHPLARRIWIVATALDSKDVPQDLVGVAADGLKSALRNRGIETEHWALKVDPLSNHKGAQSHIFDITLEAGRLTSHVHTASSPYWNDITRRVCLGWTTWKDEEITGAQKLLIQARPKYDGRTNNLQQLARLLAKHIEFSMPPAVSKEVVAATTPPVNASQMTLVSAPHSASSPSTDTDVKTAVHSAPTSIRKTKGTNTTRVSAAAAKDGERSTQSSIRASHMHQRLYPHPAPASERQTHRQSTYDLRTRTHSDASQAYAGEAQRRSRRKSEAPADRLAEMHAVRPPRNKSRSSRRDSVLSSGGGSAHAISTLMPPLPLPLQAYGMMNVWPGSMPASPPMVMHAMPFFPHHPGMSMVGTGFGPPMPLMPLLTPPSPGFHSHASSAVPTPPESPHLTPTTTAAAMHTAKPLPALHNARTCI